MGMLEDVTLFARVVEKGSFSAAGRDLRLSAAVVSHRIMALEMRLGARLFSRTTRSMHLTTSGQLFHERALDLMEAATRAEAAISDESGVPKGPIKVTAPLGLGRRLLGPAVVRFRETYPGIDIRVRLSEHLLDLVDEGIDVALRLAEMPDSSFIMKKAADVERMLCASPAYLRSAGAPLAPAELARHRCLLLRFAGSRQFRWPVIGQDGKTELVTVSGPFDADDGDLLTQWALDGQGIVLKPIFEVAQHVADGSLVPVLPGFRPTPVTLAVLWQTRQLVPPKIRIFAHFLAEEARRYVEAEMKKADGVSAVRP
jgi:DNA-binding transcriptional LysR family regulator